MWTRAADLDRSGRAGRVVGRALRVGRSGRGGVGPRHRGLGGLAGVNVNTGETARSIRLGDPDARFISDEILDLLYTAKGQRLYAYALDARD